MKICSLMPILYQPTVHRLFVVTDPSPLPLDDQYDLNADLNISQVVVVHKYISRSICSVITIYDTKRSRVAS
jgi:hypothetical protein